MKEHLPLKRIFIGLVSCAAAAGIAAAGTIDNTVLVHPEVTPDSYIVKSEALEDDTDSAEAKVVALNHEETNNITNLIDLTVSSSAFEAAEEMEQETEESISEEPETEDAANEPQGEYEVEDWWKAELSDYTETLEQQGLVATELPVTEEQPAETEAEPEDDDVQEQPAAGSTVIQEASSPSEGIWSGSADVILPSELSSYTVYFTSYGYGHGVGMSQNGANYYAKYGGYNYLQILDHYYPGTSVEYVPGGGSETFTVRGIRGSAAEIVAMVCNAEIGPSFEVETIKAQAVAAYTFIKYHGGVTSGVAIKGSPDQKIVDAVNEVIGQAVMYDGSPALTMFCASSGGMTSSSKDILYNDVPYLRSVVSEYDAMYDPHYGETMSMSVDTLRYKIQSQYGISLSSSYGQWIQPIVGDGGYVSKVCIDGQKTVNGYDFARILGLKTPKFAVYCN